MSTETEEIVEEPSPTSGAPLVLSVPVSSFDLLEGSAEGRDRVRVLNGVVLIIMVTIVAVMLSRGVLMRLEAGSETSRAEQLTTETAQIQAELQTRRLAGEVSSTAVERHIADRLALIEEISGPQIDYARILTDLNGLSSDVTVTSITFAATAAVATPGEGGPAAAPTTTVALAPTPDQGTVVLTVSGTSATTAAANGATRALSDSQQFPYLTRGAPGSVACATTSATNTNPCTWTWSGAITEAGTVDRTAGLTEQNQPVATEGGS